PALARRRLDAGGSVVAGAEAGGGAARGRRLGAPRRPRRGVALAARGARLRPDPARAPRARAAGLVSPNPRESHVRHAVGAPALGSYTPGHGAQDSRRDRE